MPEWLVRYFDLTCCLTQTRPSDRKTYKPHWKRLDRSFAIWLFCFGGFFCCSGVFFCCFVCVLFLNQVFQSSFIIYREEWTKLINYSAIVIPGFLSEIATLQVFLGAACSLAGWGAAQTLLVSTLSYGTCFLSCAFNMSGMPSLYVFPA